MTTYQQFLISRQIVPLTIVITASGAGNRIAPVGFSSVTVEAIGGGGAGFGNNSTNNRAGGGGGQYAISNAKISITGGTTVIYYSVGAASTDSWVNVGTNSAPGAATAGCLAKAGGAASSGTGGVGNVAGSIGATTRNGGTGTTGNNSVGGGGAGASTAGSGSTGGTDTTALSSILMGGGTGGAYNTGTGTAPGGGGGGAGATGTNLAGAIGRVRLTFYV